MINAVIVLCAFLMVLVPILSFSWFSERKMSHYWYEKLMQSPDYEKAWRRAYKELRRQWAIDGIICETRGWSGPNKIVYFVKETHYDKR